MVDFFNVIQDTISYGLMIGFGWYSLFLFILKLFRYKREFLVDFDKYACRTVVSLGVLLGIVFILNVGVYYFQANETDRMVFSQRLTGPYSFGIWLQPLFWVLLTQLLRIKLFQKAILYRIIMSIFFLLTFERLVIIFTSFHRDYLPSSWTMFTSEFEFPWLEFLISIPIKIVVFALVVFAYISINQYIVKFKISRQ